ncbi:tRNA lysidine(34) synthetase TilS [Paracoccaceae bacterium]|nr:tRNA lysidine(34) synthetase TilS [Paracoccaceae bacterium]
MSFDFDVISAKFNKKIDNFLDGLSYHPDTLGVAVSGGSDSLSLLYLIDAWSNKKNLKIVILTVDHNLRNGSADEALYVGELCNKLGLIHKTLFWDHEDIEGNLSASAREARYRLMQNSIPSDAILITGHTLDDQAETFLMRLRRGSGVDGLASMAEQSYLSFGNDGITIFRPLLDFERQTLRKVLKFYKVDWIEDPTNNDRSFERVRVRDLLARFVEIGIDKNTIGRTALLMQSAKTALNHFASDCYEKFGSCDNGDIIFDFSEFSKQPLDVKRRLISAAQKWISNQKYRPRLSQVDALINSIDEKVTFSGSGTICYFHNNSIRITREANACVCEIEASNDVIFDRRWKLIALENCKDLTIKCLGEDGYTFLEPGIRKKIPYKTIIALPALFNDTNLINFPFIDPESKFKFNLCKQPFNQFLLDH